MMKNYKKFQLKYLAIFFAIVLFGFTSCKKEDPLKPDETVGPKQTPDDPGSLTNKVDKTNSSTFQYDQINNKKIKKEKHP